MNLAKVCTNLRKVGFAPAPHGRSGRTPPAAGHFRPVRANALRHIRPVRAHAFRNRRCSRRRRVSSPRPCPRNRRRVKRPDLRAQGCPPAPSAEDGQATNPAKASRAIIVAGAQRREHQRHLCAHEDGPQLGSTVVRLMITSSCSRGISLIIAISDGAVLARSSSPLRRALPAAICEFSVNRRFLISTSIRAGTSPIGHSFQRPSSPQRHGDTENDF